MAGHAHGHWSCAVLCALLYLALLQARTQGVHRCQWTPLEVSSFASKSTASALTACEHVFAIDHDRVSSHAHATFIQLSRIWSLQSAKASSTVKLGEASYWLRCPGAARADHFGAKRWAQLLFEKAPWRGEELQRPLFSPSKTRSVECRATLFVVAWHTGKESLKGTLLPRLIRTSSSFDIRKMLGCCGQIARRWHCLGAQVLVFLAKDKGETLRVTAFSRREERSLIHGVRRRVRLVAWLRGSGSGAERQWTTLSQLVWQDTDLTRPKCCILDRFRTFSTHESLGKYRWCSRSLTIDLLQTRQHQCGKASSQGEYSELQGEYSESSTRACTSCTPYRWTGRECMWIWLWTASFGRGSQWGTVSKIRNTNKPHGAVKNKTQNWAILWHWLFGIKACGWADLIQLEVVRMTMYEENSMDFCITTLG